MDVLVLFEQLHIISYMEYLSTGVFYVVVPNLMFSFNICKCKIYQDTIDMG